MVKRVFIIHGWDSYPEDCWFPWLKAELEKKGFEVQVPLMPNKASPKIEEWVPFLKELVKNPDKETFFVGHSIGCQTILRYLESLDIKIKVNTVFLVAGWINLMNLNSDEEKTVARPWLETPINWEKIKNHAEKFVAIFSDNDRWVPLSDSDIFKKKLNAKIFIEKNKGHFSESDGVKKIPVLLKELSAAAGI